MITGRKDLSQMVIAWLLLAIAAPAVSAISFNYYYYYAFSDFQTDYAKTDVFLKALRYWSMGREVFPGRDDGFGVVRGFPCIVNLEIFGHTERTA